MSVFLNVLRCMASVTVLTTQKEKIVNDVRKVTMIHHGGQQLLKIPLNAQVRLVWKTKVNGEVKH